MGARAMGLGSLASMWLAGCAFTARAGPTVWSHPGEATMVGARGAAGAGIGDDHAGFVIDAGLGGGVEVESGLGALAGGLGLEYFRVPEPIGFRFGSQADVRAVFTEEPTGQATGWVVPQALGAVTFLLTDIPTSSDTEAVGIGIEATAGFAIPMNDDTRSAIALGLTVSLEWWRINSWSLNVR